MTKAHQIVETKKDPGRRTEFSLDLDEIRQLLTINRTESLTTALRRAIDWISSALPFEGVALVFSDSERQTLRGYAGGGIFKYEEVLKEFILPGFPDNSKPRFPIQEAWISFNPSETRSRPAIHKELEALWSEGSRQAFFLTDMQSLVSRGKIRFNPRVYHDGDKLIEFLALPFLSRNNEVAGMLVLNNPKTGSLSEQGYRNYLIPHTWNVAQLVFLSLSGLLVEKTQHLTTQLFKGIRRALEFPISPTSTRNTLLSNCTRIISEVISSQLRPHSASAFLREPECDPEVVWSNSSAAAEEIRNSFKIAGLSLSSSFNLLRTRKTLLLPLIDNCKQVFASVLSVCLWVGEDQQQDVSLYLIRIHKEEDGNIDLYLPEHRRTLEHVAGEIQNKIDFLVMAQRLLDTRRMHWKTLAARTGHKLISPLESIKLKMTYLAQKMGIEDRAEPMELSAVRGRLLSITDDFDSIFTMLREFMRLMGTDHLELGLCEPSDLIEEAVSKVVSPEIENSLVIDIESNVPRVMADKEKIVDAIGELVFNSKKYRSQDSRIEITARTNLEDDRLVIDIWNGGEISDDLLKNERLFEPFVTGGSQLGTGIGLSYVKEVVERHGGRLSVSSGRTEGTRFSLSLPLERSSQRGNTGL